MRPTIHFGDLTEDAETFHRRYSRSAAALHRLGVSPGDVVALLLQNEPVTLELMLACRSIGARFCPVNWHFKADEVRHILNDSGARILIAHANLLPEIRQVIPRGVRVFFVTPCNRTLRAFGIAPDTLHGLDGLECWASCRDAQAITPTPRVRPGSMMAYTSGTTGLPKGVLREAPSDEQLELLSRTCTTVLGTEPGMRALISAPLYHSAPSTYIVQAATHDADIWIEPRFDAEETLRIVASERISHVYLVPTMLRRLLRLPPEVRDRYDVTSVRFVACTGAPCPADTKQQMIEWWGPVIHEAYAASELGYVTHIDSEESLRKPGAAGRPIDGVTVKILSQAGLQLPAGEVGLIYARAAAMPDFTYKGNEEARRRLERDGLWTLGDMGYVDGDGYLFVVDRQVDMVISGGVNIYPAEVESVLLTMPGIADCAVFGIPDDDYGETLAAAIQLQPGADCSSERIQAYLRLRLAGYKIPRQIRFHDRLPREDTGKIFKRKLREPFWRGVNRSV